VGLPKPPAKLKAEDRVKYIYEAALRIIDRKIDAVVQNEEETWILETKIRLNPSAVGQAITYRELYQQTFPEDHRRVRAGIICEYDDPMVRRVAEAQGLTIFLCPPNKTEARTQ